MGNIFRAYDVRGIYPTEFDENRAYLISKAVVKFLNAKRIVVGEDGRKSSPTIREAVVRGAVDMGCDIISIGLTTTPLFYFATSHLGADGGIMVTASHNKPDYNGLKIIDQSCLTIGSGDGLMKIKEISETKIESGQKNGRAHDNKDSQDNYIDWVLDRANIKPGELDGLRVGVKTLNYSTNILRKILTGLGLNLVSDSPDLIIDFDNDGDRIIFYDDRGQLIPSYKILMLLWQNMGWWFFKPEIVYTASLSRNASDYFGGRGRVSAVGRVGVVKKMKETGASLGGENSGHIFFKKTNYSECPELVALEIMRIIKKSGESFSSVLNKLPCPYISSGEINIACDDPKIIMARLKNLYWNQEVIEIDGVSVIDKDWWFNLRPSNTEPLVRLIVEARTQELLSHKVIEIEGLLK
jgi:phosphomannomutase